MTVETLWIPTVGEWISVPSGLTPAVMVVTKRVKRNGQPFIQCGDQLVPLELCQKPQWLPQPGERVRAKICRYEGTVNGLFVHEQGYVMADCRMYRQESGKPVPPDFRIWTSPVAFLEPVKGGKHG
jgi:hypothetical protein